MKVILPVKDVPIGSIVTKPTGEKEYTVRKTIKIYGLSKELDPQEMMSDGVRFLVSDNGDLTAIQENKEVAWNVDPADLYSYLYQLLHMDNK